MTREEYNKIVSNYKPLKEKAWEEYQKILNQERESLIKMFDLEGKFIKIGGEDETPKYMYVATSFRHKTISNEHSFILRGQGFIGIVTEHEDSTFMSWDQFFDHTIYFSNLESEIKNIEIITEEEYNEAFEKLLLEIKQEHYNYLKKQMLKYENK